MTFLENHELSTQLEKEIEAGKALKKRKRAISQAKIEKLEASCSELEQRNQALLQEVEELNRVRRDLSVFEILDRESAKKCSEKSICRIWQLMDNQRTQIENLSSQVAQKGSLVERVRLFCQQNFTKISKKRNKKVNDITGSEVSRSSFEGTNDISSGIETEFSDADILKTLNKVNKRLFDLKKSKKAELNKMRIQSEAALNGIREQFQDMLQEQFKLLEGNSKELVRLKKENRAEKEQMANQLGSKIKELEEDKVTLQEQIGGYLSDIQSLQTKINQQTEIIEKMNSVVLVDKASHTRTHLIDKGLQIELAESARSKDGVDTRNLGKRDEDGDWRKERLEEPSNQLLVERNDLELDFGLEGSDVATKDKSMPSNLKTSTKPAVVTKEKQTLTEKVAREHKETNTEPKMISKFGKIPKILEKNSKNSDSEWMDKCAVLANFFAGVHQKWVKMINIKYCFWEMAEGFLKGYELDPNSKSYTFFEARKCFWSIRFTIRLRKILEKSKNQKNFEIEGKTEENRVGVRPCGVQMYQQMMLIASASNIHSINLVLKLKTSKTPEIALKEFFSHRGLVMLHPTKKFNFKTFNRPKNDLEDQIRQEEDLSIVNEADNESIGSEEDIMISLGVQTLENGLTGLKGINACTQTLSELNGEEKVTQLREQLQECNQKVLNAQSTLLSAFDSLKTKDKLIEQLRAANQTKSPVANLSIYGGFLSDKCSQGSTFSSN